MTCCAPRLVSFDAPRGDGLTKLTKGAPGKVEARQTGEKVSKDERPTSAVSRRRAGHRGLAPPGCGRRSEVRGPSVRRLWRSKEAFRETRQSGTPSSGCEMVSPALNTVVNPQPFSTDVNGFPGNMPPVVGAPGVAASAEHLGRLEEEGRRKGQAQRLGRLQVDHELEGGRLLHRQVGRLRPLEEAVHIVRRALELLP